MLDMLCTWNPQHSKVFSYPLSSCGRGLLQHLGFWLFSRKQKVSWWIFHNYLSAKSYIWVKDNFLCIPVLDWVYHLKKNIFSLLVYCFSPLLYFRSLLLYIFDCDEDEKISLLVLKSTHFHSVRHNEFVHPTFTIGYIS